jgi:hypothetical protein
MTKSEYQNPKQFPMIEIQNLKQRVPMAASVLNIQILGFPLVSSFGFRISDFV